MESAKIQEKIVSSEKSFTKRIIYQDDNIVTFVLNFQPGQVLPPHTHYDSTVVVKIHAGSGEVTVDGKAMPVTKGDIISVKGNEELRVSNNGQEDLTLYVNMAPRPANPGYSKDVG